MADPISILGTAGAVANIIDVLGKVITTFAELRSQWHEADFTLLALESELAALNAALNKIKEWAESCSDDPHHQLTMDLDRCVVCCRLLIGRIDAEISQFQITPENRLDVTSRLRLLLKTKDFEHIQQMIGKQTAAMTLLLIACNTTMLSKQKVLLEDSDTRKVFKKMEDDTASLLVHRDVDSLVTGTATSITSSKRSIIFDFDSKLFTTRIYQRWIRGSVKKSLLQQQYEKLGTAASWPKTSQSDEKLLARRSRDIDITLIREEKSLRRELKILVVGDRSRFDIVHRMRLSNSIDSPDEQLCRYKPLIYANVVRCAKAMAKAMVEHKHGPQDGEIWKHVGHIVDAPDIETERLDPTLVAGVAAIIASPYFSMARNDEFGLPSATEYFLSRIFTIASPNYVPTSPDIMRVEIRNGFGVSETRIHLQSLTLHLVDPDSYVTEKKRWLPFCEDSFAMIFVVDLSSYDQALVEDRHANQMMETMMFFESIVNSHWLSRTYVILCFTNHDIFQEKLKTSPLQFHFSDFTARTSQSTATAGMEYFRAKFKALNRTKRHIYSHFVSSDDHGIMRRIADNISDITLQSNLRYSSKALLP
ncbi:G-protein alpha subunit domain containing protein [Naviculisporaceae sp. PSN 640]